MGMEGEKSKEQAAPKHLLLVEDTQTAGAHFRDLFRLPKYEVKTASTPQEARGVLAEMIRVRGGLSCVIVDLTLKEDYFDGIELIRAFHKEHENLPILVWTKHSPSVIEQAIDAGATRAVEKYEDDNFLVQTVDELTGKINENETNS